MWALCFKDDSGHTYIYRGKDGLNRHTANRIYHQLTGWIRDENNPMTEKMARNLRCKMETVLERCIDGR